MANNLARLPLEASLGRRLTKKVSIDSTLLRTLRHGWACCSGSTTFSMWPIRAARSSISIPLAVWCSTESAARVPENRLSLIFQVLHWNPSELAED